MRIARAVDHGAAAIGHDRPPEREAHPVGARHPRAVAIEARGLEARAHRQQIGDRDVPLGRLRRITQLPREESADALLRSLELPLGDRNPDERRDDALRHRFDVGGARARRPVIVALADDASVHRNEKAAQLRELRAALERRREPVGLDRPRRLRRRVRRNQPERPRGPEKPSPSADPEPLSALSALSALYGTGGAFGSIRRSTARC